MILTTKIKQHLKAKAHSLKPVILLGNKGLTDAVKKEINLALQHHELIKIRIPVTGREVRLELAANICESSQAECLQMIGQAGVFYRKRVD